MPKTDVEKKGDVALRWMERSWFIGDPVLALLFTFFALEALLGDKSEGLKAHGLAFRQTMLAHIVDGGFSPPSTTVLLYEDVRSAAVHGEQVPEIDWDVTHNFADVVRRTLNQYLTLERERGLARRGALLDVLNRHPDRPQLIEWMRQNDGPAWNSYLERLQAGRDP